MGLDIPSLSECIEVRKVPSKNVQVLVFIKTFSQPSFQCSSRQKIGSECLNFSSCSLNSSFRSVGDEAFMKAFEDTTLLFEDWSHEAHLRMAWNYIKKYGKENATPLIR